MRSEVGHFLGVDHLPSPAIMMAQQTANWPQELTDADLNALHDRYGEVAQPAYRDLTSAEPRPATH